MRMDTRRLCELTGAADVLELKVLVDLTSRALARVIEARPPASLRLVFSHVLFPEEQRYQIGVGILYL